MQPDVHHGCSAGRLQLDFHHGRLTLTEQGAPPAAASETAAGPVTGLRPHAWASIMRGDPMHPARSPSEYWRRPRCERRGASCEARRRGDAPAHRRGGATRQMAPRRRNPKGAWGLRPQTASHVVADAHRHRLAALLVCSSQDPRARPTRILGRAPRPANGAEAPRPREAPGPAPPAARCPFGAGRQPVFSLVAPCSADRGFGQPGSRFVAGLSPRAASRPPRACRSAPHRPAGTPTTPVPRT